MFIEKSMFQTSERANIWQVLKIAFPLILANAGHTLNLFTDRLMLQRYSAETMSAAFPAGLTHFAFICFFVGVVAYGNSFVAQYHGAKMFHRVGAAVWHAVYMAVIGGIFSASLYFIAPWLFKQFGHADNLQPLEVEYFRLLALAGVIPLLMIALSSFWGGQGKTKMIMVMNLLNTFFNIPFNAVLIFGVPSLGIPAYGIRGAAYGTILAGIIPIAVMFICILSRRNRAQFRTLNIKLDKDLFYRMIRFGGPNGIQLLLDLGAFNAFVVLLGKISEDVLNASGVAFSLNSLAMIPMFGFGQTVSILIGQAIGAQDIEYAEKITKTSRFCLLVTVGILACFFAFYPEPALEMFKLQQGTEVFRLTRIMLVFIAAYLLFDAASILYGSAIKGAGDTKFAMYIGASFAWIFYGIPCLLTYRFFSSGYAIGKLGAEMADAVNLWTLWGICVAYIMILGITFFLRYRGGKWKEMRVIESEHNDHPRGSIPKETGIDAALP